MYLRRVKYIHLLVYFTKNYSMGAYGGVGLYLPLGAGGEFHSHFSIPASTKLLIPTE